MFRGEIKKLLALWIPGRIFKSRKRLKYSCFEYDIRSREALA